jgi:hypothetical protein
VSSSITTTGSPSGNSRPEHCPEEGAHQEHNCNRQEQWQREPAAIAAIIFAVIAASGFLVFGVGVLAVFAVGAGQIALNQIPLRGERMGSHWGSYLVAVAVYNS